ncbi:MAG: hypothetical protein GY900_11420 [Actinomycetia bacterium]|nr:hypothetical protein [Actinomycetes bacterium]
MTGEDQVWMSGDPAPAVGSCRGEASRLVRASRLVGDPPVSTGFREYGPR